MMLVLIEHADDRALLFGFEKRSEQKAFVWGCGDFVLNYTHISFDKLIFVC